MIKLTIIQITASDCNTKSKTLLPAVVILGTIKGIEMIQGNRAVDITGNKYNFLTALKYIRSYKTTSKARQIWLFRCDCGNEKEIIKGNVMQGTVKSCGCMTKALLSASAKKQIKHGLHGTPLYFCYHAMKQRCNNPKLKSYKNYGGRGITICKEWLDNPEAFYNWALCNGYSESLQIDRIDVNGNYEPNNCRFITHAEQQKNKRNSRRIQSD